MKKRMYATVRRYEGIPDPEKAAQDVEKKFVPFISSFRASWDIPGLDLTGGAMLSITVFKTLPEAIAANEKATVWVNDNLRAVLPHTARMEAGK